MAEELKDAESVPYVTAASLHGVEDRVAGPLNAKIDYGMSHTPGLEELPDSSVPGHEHKHVQGPQQSPVDPVAAGLSTSHIPFTRNENRVVTRTGEIASGAHTPGTTQAVSDGSMEAMPLDKVADKAPGPNAAPKGEPLADDTGALPPPPIVEKAGG